MSVSDRRSWDASRFLETLNYFGEVPFIGSFRWLQQLMGQKTTYTGVDVSAVKKKVVVLSSDGGKAVSVEDGDSDCDTYQSKSWQNRFESQIQSQLVAPADFVFYSLGCEACTHNELSTLIASSTVTIILGTSALSTLLNGCKGILSESSDFLERPIFDFSESSELLAAWGVLDDVVMGGVSQSGLSLNDKRQAVFAGNVSVENSGGFASVRTKNFEPPFNFSSWQGVRLRVKGDGQRYKFILRNSDGWDSPAYIYSFDTQPDEWLTVNVPFSSMVPTFRAKSMPDAPALDPAKVYSFQLMLSKFEYDRQLNPQFEPGPFSLEVNAISVYRQRQNVPLMVAASKSEPTDVWQSKLAEMDVDYRWVELEDADLPAIATALAETVAVLLHD